jgi:hypothetical protein
VDKDKNKNTDKDSKIKYNLGVVKAKYYRSGMASLRLVWGCWL